MSALGPSTATTDQAQPTVLSTRLIESVEERREEGRERENGRSKEKVKRGSSKIERVKERVERVRKEG